MTQIACHATEREKQVMAANVGTDIGKSISEFCVFKEANQCVARYLHGDSSLGVDPVWPVQ